MTLIPDNRKIDAAGSRQVKGIESGGDYGLVSQSLTTFSLIDDGGGATYTYDESVSGTVVYNAKAGRRTIVVTFGNINTVGTPTGDLKIEMTGVPTVEIDGTLGGWQIYHSFYLRNFQGSDYATPEKIRPYWGFGFDVLFNEIDNDDTPIGAVTFTSGSLKLIIQL